MKKKPPEYMYVHAQQHTKRQLRQEQAIRYALRLYAAVCGAMFYPMPNVPFVRLRFYDLPFDSAE